MTKRKTNYKKAIWEAVKEPLRLLVIAIIPIALSYFSELDYTWTAIIVLVLRLADKLMHEIGKATKNKALVRGITQF